MWLREEFTNVVSGAFKYRLEYEAQNIFPVEKGIPFSYC